MTNPTVFIDTSAVAARQFEVPEANFDNGCNNAASNSSGIGINVDGGAVSGDINEFTLLDQFENPRIPQIGQSIGGYPYTPNAIYPSSGGLPGTEPNAVIVTGEAVPDGTIVFDGATTLVTLPEGWQALTGGNAWVDQENWVDAEDWVET